MLEDYYKTLGEVKCEELTKKYESLWEMLSLSHTRKSTQVSGNVLEGVAKDFIREFLPMGFTVKSGLIFDVETKKMSPQIDGIIYSGAPLLGFTDVAVVEKDQVKAVLEVKSWIHTTDLFGEKKGEKRDSSSGLVFHYRRIKEFLAPTAKYILFLFELHSGYSDADVTKRLSKVCDLPGVVVRKESLVERAQGKEDWEYDFNHSVAELIKWLRSLSLT